MELFRRRRTGQAREHRIDALACGHGGHAQTLQLGVFYGDRTQEFRFARLSAGFDSLLFGDGSGQLGTQIDFCLPRLGQQVVDRAIMFLQLCLQCLDFRLVRLTTLLERALSGLALVEAGTQHVTLGLKVPGELHELPDTGREVI